jgi:hypothetical protein
MLSEEKMNDGLNNRRSRILLLDDDVDITTSLKIGLEDNGFVCIITRSAIILLFSLLIKSSLKKT